MQYVKETTGEATCMQIQVITHNDIPAIYSVEQDGKTHNIGELRDFHWHETLQRFMPPAKEFSIAWVHLKEHEILSPHTHPMQSMMIFYQGTGQLIGQIKHTLKAGDTLIVPAGCEHGFIGGAGGLHAFSIQFGEAIYANPQHGQVTFNDSEFNLEKLITHNQQRLQQFAKKRIFQLLQDGTLGNEKKRQTYHANLQIWVNGNQTLLFTRQATCQGSPYEKTFLQHLHEEIGHDHLHNKHTPLKVTAKDSILEAITNWVSYQMLVLDNIEKTALVHLVIENASDHYHKMAAPQLAKYLGDEYFNVHIENDMSHAALGIALLENQHPRTYLRLKLIVDETWDMLDAMVDRVAELTDAA